MTEKQTYFAVDLGATSGRTIIGTLENGKFSLEELTRFDNNLIHTCGHFYWDIFALYNEVIRGLKLAAQRGIQLTSIGIDTWGVDFVLIGDDGAPLRNPIAYRDPHTFGRMEEYFDKCVDKKTVYDITGIQFMNFNSLFQLYAMRCNNDAALPHAKHILFVPDALSYMLTGEVVCEYTIASTSQMLDPRTGDLDSRLLESVGIERSQFGPIVQPGTVIGCLTPDVQSETGLGAVPVVAVAGHDTGSAVAAVPAANAHFAYLSSGTWSLMGIETPHAIIDEVSYERNFTNEGGIEGTTRFLKNICGMWLYERCRRSGPTHPNRIPNCRHRPWRLHPSRASSTPMTPASPIPLPWSTPYSSTAATPDSTCPRDMPRYADASSTRSHCATVRCLDGSAKWPDIPSMCSTSSEVVRSTSISTSSPPIPVA